LSTLLVPTIPRLRRFVVTLRASTLQQQLAEITQQADAAVTSALAGADTEAHAALAEQLEQQAQWAENGEEPDSPYLDLAVHLRGLIAQLWVGNADDAPGDAF
jgi:hypothetical protein